MNNLPAHIEALLFALGESLSRKDLAQMLNVDLETLEIALEALKEDTVSKLRGIAVVDDGTEVQLRIAPHAAELVEKVRKERYNRDIGKAGLEVLAAVLYKGPLSRSQIDFIRGVNSSQTLRTLAMRGLLRKEPNPKDERSYLYEATTEVLSELGVHSVKELPEYETITAKLRQLEEKPQAAQTENP